MLSLASQGQEANPAMELLQKSLPRLTAALGIESYADFQKASYRSILGSFEAEFFKELMALPQVQAHIGTIDIDVVSLENKLGRLQIRRTPEEAAFSSAEEISVIPRR